MTQDQDTEACTARLTFDDLPQASLYDGGLCAFIIASLYLPSDRVIVLDDPNHPDIRPTGPQAVIALRARIALGHRTFGVDNDVCSGREELIYNGTSMCTSHFMQAHMRSPQPWVYTSDR